MLGWLRDKLGQTFEGRSGKWPKVRAEHLRQEPDCQVCGKVGGNSVHHLKPVHLFPELELCVSNLITLCPEHHLLFGHLMRWESWNERCVADAGEWKRKIKSRP